MVIEKGQIYWCGLDPVQGHEQGLTRPAVIFSADAYNQTRSPLTAIVPLTKSPVNPIHLRFTAEETGLDSDSTALTDHARFIDRVRLRGEPIGHLSPVAMALLNRQLTRVFGL
jgi:mRNA interferase MazF